MTELNLYEELLQMREKYKNKPLKDVKLSRPPWLSLNDPMSELFSQKSILLKQGEIVYASIIQANSILFKSFPPLDCPAHIVYSTDPYFIKQPDALTDISWEIIQYKGQAIDTVTDDWKEVARVITDEYDRSDFDLSLNVNGQTVKYKLIPTMIYRKLLPKRKLCGNLLPVLSVPDCKQIMVLPKKYWTKSFTQAWIKGLV